MIFSFLITKNYHHILWFSTIPWTSCIDKTMLWIKDKTKPTNLVFMYFDEPDNTAHVYGIGSRETNEKIAKVDETIRYV